MAGGRHNDEAGSSNPRKPFWELLEEMESQDPNYEPPADEEMDEAGDASSDEEMDEAGGHEDDSTTDGGGGGEPTDGGSQGKKARKDRNPITVGLIRQEFERQAKPSSAGRVPGFGAVPWSEYYGTVGDRCR